MDSEVLDKRNLDGALKVVGSFGRFHKALLLLNVCFNLITPWLTQVITFIGETPQHVCKPRIGDNDTSYDEPVFFSTVSPELLTCERYVDPVWRNETEECTDGWWYSKETYGETIVTEGFWSNCHILLLEYLVPSKRSTISAFPPFFQSFGSVLLAVLAYFVRDWRYLQAVLISPAVVLLLVVWLIPESARWHISRGKFDKSEDVLKRIAVINGKTSQGPYLREYVSDEDIIGILPSDTNAPQRTHSESTEHTKYGAETYDVANVYTNQGFSTAQDNEVPFPSASRTDQSQINDGVSANHIRIYQERESKLVQDDKTNDSCERKIPTISEKVNAVSCDSDSGNLRTSKKSILDVLKPPVLYITLSICTIRTVYLVVYFGFVLNTGNLAGNPYLNFIIGGLIEIPARIIPVFLIKRLGVRFIASIFFFLSAVTLVVIMLLPEETSDGKSLGTVITAVSLFGRFLVTVTNAPCLLLPMELFPTTVRTLGTGLAQFFGRFGGFLAPLMLYLDNIFPGFSLIAMAVSSLTASILAFLLPETLNEPQPETPEDLKKLMRKKRRIIPSKPKDQTK
ncbi:organic cation transporter protein-like isoform X2 [Apostichopus japonicus]|uniref:organic cation transporter protein-like isoform X2 n=1 Tax=Stichopus japonicus TaxID=307972 RepID=UPI003AB45B93